MQPVKDAQFQNFRRLYISNREPAEEVSNQWATDVSNDEHIHTILLSNFFYPKEPRPHHLRHISSFKIQIIDSSHQFNL